MLLKVPPFVAVPIAPHFEPGWRRFAATDFSLAELAARGQKKHLEVSRNNRVTTKLTGGNGAQRNCRPVW